MSLRLPQALKRGPKSVGKQKLLFGTGTQLGHDQAAAEHLKRIHAAVRNSSSGSASSSSDAHRSADAAAGADAAPAALVRHVTPHTGQLLGMTERHCLEVFSLVHGQCGLVPGAALHRTAMRLMTHGCGALGAAYLGAGGSASGGGGGGGAQTTALAAPQRPDASAHGAQEAMLWVAVALGCVLQRAGFAEVQRYMLCASAALMACQEPTPELLHAYCLMAWAHIVLDGAGVKVTFAGFYSYFHRALLVRRALLDDVMPGRAPPALDEDTRVLLERLRLSQGFIDGFLASHADAKRVVDRQLGKGIQRRCHEESENCRDGTPGSYYNVYAPMIPGLPVYVVPDETDDQEAPVGPYQGRQPYIHERTVVKEALSKLGQPEMTGTDALVAAATRGFTSLTPVLSALDHRIVQVMHMLNAEEDTAMDFELSAARAIGRRVRVIADQLASALGADFFARPSYPQLELAYLTFFVRLLDDDEEGALEMLLHCARALCSAPGLLTYPFLRHNAHWVAAMLLSAGRRAEHDQLVGIYNSMDLMGGRDKLPVTEDEKTTMCRCRHFRCAATHKIAARRVTRARIFAHYTQRHLDDDAVPTTQLTAPPTVSNYINGPDIKVYIPFKPEEVEGGPQTNGGGGGHKRTASEGDGSSSGGSSGSSSGDEQPPHNSGGGGGSGSGAATTVIAADQQMPAAANAAAVHMHGDIAAQAVMAHGSSSSPQQAPMALQPASPALAAQPMLVPAAPAPPPLAQEDSSEWPRSHHDDDDELLLHGPPPQDPALLTRDSSDDWNQMLQNVAPVTLEPAAVAVPMLRSRQASYDWQEGLEEPELFTAAVGPDAGAHADDYFMHDSAADAPLPSLLDSAQQQRMGQLRQRSDAAAAALSRDPHQQQQQRHGTSSSERHRIGSAGQVAALADLLPLVEHELPGDLSFSNCGASGGDARGGSARRDGGADSGRSSSGSSRNSAQGSPIEVSYGDGSGAFAGVGGGAPAAAVTASIDTLVTAPTPPSFMFFEVPLRGTHSGNSSVTDWTSDAATSSSCDAREALASGSPSIVTDSQALMLPVPSILSATEDPYPYAIAGGAAATFWNNLNPAGGARPIAQPRGFADGALYSGGRTLGVVPSMGDGSSSGSSAQYVGRAPPLHRPLACCGGVEGLEVDDELLARLAAELSDEALMELADACLMSGLPTELAHSTH